MSTINDGGPAFPPAVTVSASGDVYHGFDGMTLRDWFAGQALPAACAHAFKYTDRAASMDLLPEEWAAKIADGIADAMLAAREVKP